jgi:hypothetical protein
VEWWIHVDSGFCHHLGEPQDEDVSVYKSVEFQRFVNEDCLSFNVFGYRISFLFIKSVEQKR